MSEWLQEDEVRDIFSLLQIAVFHPPWESYHPGKQARPKTLPSKEQRDEIDREKALNAFPIGTRVGKDFIDKRGDVRTFIGEVIGF